MNNTETLNTSMGNNPLVLRQVSHIKSFTKAEVWDALTEQEIKVAPEDCLIDMHPHANDAENGGWSESNSFLIAQAGLIRQKVHESGITGVHYFGLAEIPHMIALGAHIGDEIAVAMHDYDRHNNSWKWPATQQSLFVEALGTPAEIVDATGEAIIRVSITSSIRDDDIKLVVRDKPLADISIQPRPPQIPVPALVRCQADLQAVLSCFREQLAALLQFRPGTRRIHLFVSASASVCFGIGRELRLRNTPPFQLYRFREHHVPKITAAIRLEPGQEESRRELTDEELEIASQIRTVHWPAALKDVQAYARSLQTRSQVDTKCWYESLHGFNKVNAGNPIRPYPGLPSAWDVVRLDATVDPGQPKTEPYAAGTRNHRWYLGDELLLSLWRATEGDTERLKRLIRLFLFHEYVHEHHILTKVTADQVGRFENCLERLDYGADLYALLHEFDFSIDRGLLSPDSDKDQRQFLADQIDLIIRSFWAFEPERPSLRWQMRRVRRHLNWYWRQVQVEQAPDLLTALKILEKAPTVEITGLHHFLEGRRYFVEMDETKVLQDTDLEMGIVTENDSFVRIPNQTNANLKELIAAFREGNHEAIKEFFDSAFKFVKQTNGAFPPN